MSKYRIIEIKREENVEWDNLVYNSPQGSIFAKSIYLESVGIPFVRYLVKKGQETKAAFLLMIPSNSREAILDDLVIYSGLMFHQEELQRPVRARQERFEITEFVIESVVNDYERLEFALHPNFEDIRPFLWYNYHSSDMNNKFSVDVRYTSYLDISEFFLKNEDENTLLYQNLDNIRQSDLRKARQNELSVIEHTDSRLYCEFYKEMMEDKGIQVEESKLHRMEGLIHQLIKIGLAKMYVTVDPSGTINYLSVFSLFRNRGCYLFGAGRRDSMNRYDGTFCVWEALKSLSNYGINAVDMEGVNSPQRGSFKLSFGGDLKPYYQINKGVSHIE